MNDNQHLVRSVSCRDCEWTGVTGELIASGRSPELLCPACDSMRIKYLILEPSKLTQ